MINLSNTPAREHPVTVTPKPDGVALGLGDYPAHFLKDFLNLLAENGDLREQLDLLLDTEPPKHDPHKKDVASRDDVFIANSLAELNPASLAIRLHGAAVEKLAANLAPGTTGLPTEWKAVA